MPNLEFDIDSSWVEVYGRNLKDEVKKSEVKTSAKCHEAIGLPAGGAYRKSTYESHENLMRILCESHETIDENLLNL